MDSYAVPGCRRQPGREAPLACRADQHLPDFETASDLGRNVACSLAAAPLLAPSPAAAAHRGQPAARPSHSADVRAASKQSKLDRLDAILHRLTTLESTLDALESKIYREMTSTRSGSETPVPPAVHPSLRSAPCQFRSAVGPVPLVVHSQPAGRRAVECESQSPSSSTGPCFASAVTYGICLPVLAARPPSPVALRSPAEDQDADVGVHSSPCFDNVEPARRHTPVANADPSRRGADSKNSTAQRAEPASQGWQPAESRPLSRPLPPPSQRADLVADSPAPPASAGPTGCARVAAPSPERPLRAALAPGSEADDVRPWQLRGLQDAVVDNPPVLGAEPCAGLPAPGQETAARSAPLRRAACPEDVDVPVCSESKERPHAAAPGRARSGALSVPWDSVRAAFPRKGPPWPAPRWAPEPSFFGGPWHPVPPLMLVKDALLSLSAAYVRSLQPGLSCVLC